MFQAFLLNESFQDKTIPIFSSFFGPMILVGVGTFSQRKAHTKSRGVATLFSASLTSTKPPIFGSLDSLIDLICSSCSSVDAPKGSGGGHKRVDSRLWTRWRYWNHMKSPLFSRHLGGYSYLLQSSICFCCFSSICWPRKQLKLSSNKNWVLH